MKDITKTILSSERFLAAEKYLLTKGHEEYWPKWYTKEEWKEEYLFNKENLAPLLEEIALRTIVYKEKLSSFAGKIGVVRNHSSHFVRWFVHVYVLMHPKLRKLSGFEQKAYQKKRKTEKALHDADFDAISKSADQLNYYKESLAFIANGHSWGLSDDLSSSGNTNEDLQMKYRILPSDRMEIRTLKKRAFNKFLVIQYVMNGTSQEDLAKQFSISKVNISNRICNTLSWSSDEEIIEAAKIYVSRGKNQNTITAEVLKRRGII